MSRSDVAVDANVLATLSTSSTKVCRVRSASSGGRFSNRAILCGRRLRRALVEPSRSVRDALGLTSRGLFALSSSLICFLRSGEPERRTGERRKRSGAPSGARRPAPCFVGSGADIWAMEEMWCMLKQMQANQHTTMERLTLELAETPSLAEEKSQCFRLGGTIIETSIEG